MDVTKENNDKAKRVSMFMLLSSLKGTITLCVTGDGEVKTV